MQHAVDRLNDKTDGWYDELLPNYTIVTASSSVGCVENQVSDRPRLCTLWDGCFRPSSAHGRRAAPAEARTMGETGAVVDGVDSHACSSSAAAASSGSGGGGGEGETVSMTLLARQ